MARDGVALTEQPTGELFIRMISGDITNCIRSGMIWPPFARRLSYRHRRRRRRWHDCPQMSPGISSYVRGFSSRDVSNLYLQSDCTGAGLGSTPVGRRCRRTTCSFVAFMLLASLRLKRRRGVNPHALARLRFRATEFHRLCAGDCRPRVTPGWHTIKPRAAITALELSR